MSETEAHQEKLGSRFLEPSMTDRNNGFIETLIGTMSVPDKALSMVAEHNGEVVGYVGALLHYSYPYARHRVSVYVMNASLKQDVDKWLKAVIIKSAFSRLVQWGKNLGATEIFGSTYHADESARAMLRRLKLRASYVRYGAEIV